LSERIRVVLSSLIEDIKSQQSVSSISLFGSWSRGDAVPSSDVDLLIVDKKEFDYEYVERVESENLLVDLNHIPEKWLVGRIPPELDQKIYEADILYDRNQRLTRTKNWVSKNCWTQERVDLRTESYLIDAYTHLSRATSAQNKGDLRSARVYATTGLEGILKTLIEVNMLPVSNSHFIEALGSSARELSMQEIFDDYLEISRLSELDRSMVEKGLNHLETAWNDAISSINALSSILETSHIRVKTNLNYYGKPFFLKGLITRSRAMIEKNAFIEASHYINRALLDMLENYAWLALTAKGAKLDYTTLFDSLGSEDSSRTIYGGAIKTLGLEDVSSTEVDESLKKTKEMISNIRQRRKELISKYVKSPA